MKSKRVCGNCKEWVGENCQICGRKMEPTRGACSFLVFENRGYEDPHDIPEINYDKIHQEVKVLIEEELVRFKERIGALSKIKKPTKSEKGLLETYKEEVKRLEGRGYSTN